MSHAGSKLWIALLLILLLIGCGLNPATAPAPTGNRTGRQPNAANSVVDTTPNGSDAEKVTESDISILFIGNSHTVAQDLPGLVSKMIQYRHPERTVYSYVVPVRFLEDTAHDSRCIDEIETRPWKYVVLQAQKISMSGRYDYSREEGIELAKRARTKGATVLFFSEWGGKGVDGEGPRTERIYQAMAEASDATVVPIGAAWDLALAERPDLTLHDSDGNHESPLGAFLTACVLFGHLTGESPATLASFQYLDVPESDRKLLANAAATAIATR